jgi:hypothetical protein
MPSPMNVGRVAQNAPSNECIPIIVTSSFETRKVELIRERLLASPVCGTLRLAWQLSRSPLAGLRVELRVTSFCVTMYKVQCLVPVFVVHLNKSYFSISTSSQGIISRQHAILNPHSSACRLSLLGHVFNRCSNSSTRFETHPPSLWTTNLT